MSSVEAEIPTPYCLIDGAKLEKNIVSMQRLVDGWGASLRPHFKTHKSSAIALMQAAAGAKGATCANLHEAEALIASGIEDVFIAFPLIADRSNRRAVERVHEDGDVLFGVESVPAARALRECLSAAGRPKVLIEVDCGCRRSGINPADAGEFAVALGKLDFDVRGIYTYPGQSYLPGKSAAASAEETQALGLALSQMEKRGLTNLVVSAGSTPTMSHGGSDIVTEYRPGTYALGDRQQVALGMDRARSALCVVATVVHSSSDRAVLDAGAKAIGRDRPAWLDGYGELVDLPRVTIDRIFDHHSVIDRQVRLPVGSRVCIFPNNANTVVNLQSVLWLSEPDGKLQPLTVEARSG
ncbi:alanine racemase [Micromonospora sp. NPDC000316]|uniref:alanine racemase n=1 Tax=Micromonospora sp. NPDC000316 TaxID=3364216 RepID=UPI003678F92C